MQREKNISNEKKQVQEPYYIQYREANKGFTMCQKDDMSSRPQKKNIDNEEYPLEESVSRTEFIKDRDRILYSKSFRRLEHKAQIFSHEKGDHFRTRLTHTIEVNQIAKSICRNLSLNEDLVEAIALGHDIGHTPFGHQGERVLDDIMSGRDDLGGQVQYPFYKGGFKHNFNGVRMIDMFESIYPNEDGLFLTWQTVDGILKHTKILDDEKHLCCDINRFAKRIDFYFRENSKGKKRIDLLSYAHPITLEGQIVSIADEIAQRQHDLDDALSNETMRISVKEVITKILSSIEDSHENDDGTVDTFKNKLEIIKQCDENDRVRRRFVSTIVEYFIMDVTYESMENIFCMEDKDKFVFKGSPNCFKDKFIYFTKTGELINDAISMYIKHRIVNSYEVTRFDAQAVYAIRQLLKAYYANPRQMTDNVLKKLNGKLETLSNEYGAVNVFVGRDKYNILLTDLRTGQPENIKLLLNLLKLEIDISFPFEENISKKLLEEFKDSVSTKESNAYCKDNHFFTGNEVSAYRYHLWKPPIVEASKGKFSETNFDAIYPLLREANYIFLSTICTYIAGMTDNFAKDEYRKLYAITN